MHSVLNILILSRYHHFSRQNHLLHSIVCSKRVAAANSSLQCKTPISVIMSKGTHTCCSPIAVSSCRYLEDSVKKHVLCVRNCVKETQLPKMGVGFKNMSKKTENSMPSKALQVFSRLWLHSIQKKYIWIGLEDQTNQKHN